MGSTSTITALGSVDALFDTDWDGLARRDRLAVLEELEMLARRTRALSHEVIAGLAKEDAATLGERADRVIADRLRISLAEARRRIRDGAQLAARSTLIGEPLPPELPVTATHWKAGLLDAEHLEVIQRFLRHLPDHIGPDLADASEQFLADKATVLRPDQLAKAADRLATYVNPDGGVLRCRPGPQTRLSLGIARPRRHEQSPPGRHPRVACQPGSLVREIRRTGPLEPGR